MGPQMSDQHLNHDTLDPQSNTYTSSNQRYLESIAQQGQLSTEIDSKLEAFYQKYGDIKIKYIEPPPHSPWFTRPYALNYFHNDILYRTKNERTSGKLELFLDLIYTGIASNLASECVEQASIYSLCKFILLFIPTYVIWSDLKDFMNYYFNDDLLQRGFVIWLLVLLIIYDNNCEFIDVSSAHGNDGDLALWTCVGVYALARISLSGMLMFYSLYIHEHRIQMRLYGYSLIITSALWFIIFKIKEENRWYFAIFMFILEQVIFCLSVHPWTKRKLKLEYSTALNIEHEDERFGGFVIIGIGELLYNIVSGSPLKLGMNEKLSRGISILLMGYLFLGIYGHKDGCLKAIHALRRSAITAILYIYLHFPLIASLLILGDSGLELIKIEQFYINTERELNLLKFFHGGILVTLITLTALSSLDKSKDDEYDQKISKKWRISMRIPVGIFIMGLTWSYEWISIGQILWIDCGLLILVYFYEFYVMNPLNFNKRVHLGLTNVQDV